MLTGALVLAIRWCLQDFVSFIVPPLDGLHYKVRLPAFGAVPWGMSHLWMSQRPSPPACRRALFDLQWLQNRVRFPLSIDSTCPLSGLHSQGQAGRICVLGGSVDYAGAPYYAGMSALRAATPTWFLGPLLPHLSALPTRFDVLCLVPMLTGC